jgi:hypothetical protein
MRLFCFTLICGLFLLGCSENDEQSFPLTYPASYTKTALLIDGLLDEPAWTAAVWSDYFIDIEGDENPAPQQQTRLKMAWDKHYLYIGAHLEEKNLWATLDQRDAIVYRDNDFEVFLDPDGDGLNYYEFEINALGTSLDLFMDKPYNKKGKADLGWDFEGLKSAIILQGTLNNNTDTDTSWTIEIAIPWTSLSADAGTPPSNGDTWRINFSRVQWDLEKTKDGYTKLDRPEHNWVWSPQGVINMHVPEKWGYVEFRGRPDEELQETPKFWFWMGASNHKTDQEWENTFRRLAAAGIKGILMGSDTNILSRVIPIADQFGMAVHAWFWTMNRNDANKEWLSVNQLGKSLAEEKAYVNYYKFMCPALPEVKDFIQSKMQALGQVEGLKGIHMDYIRYVDVILPIGLWPKYGLVQDHIMPEYDYGYHPYMRGMFREEHGYDPLEKDDPAHDSLWLAFRLKELNKTVIGLRDFVNHSGLNITAAVFPTPEMSRNMVRQDWNKWGLDCYFPMVYHNFYNEDIDWIREVMKENRAAVPEDAKIFCGLYLPALKTSNHLAQAIEAAFEGGADGVAFFDLNSLTDAQLEQISKYR